MKTKIKTKIITSLGYLTLLFIISFTIDFSLLKYTLWQLNLAHKYLGVEAYAMAEISVPRIVKLEEISVKDYILGEVKKAGLDTKKIDCLLVHESNYNQYAINKNKDGSFDIGAWQINDIHGISREDAFNYKKATDWAIKKIKKEGNMNAWYGYKNNCL